MEKKKILVMVECSVMLALAFALSWVKLWQMPLGGSVTLASMLPIMFIGMKHGAKAGFSTAFLYSLTQYAQGLIEGDVLAVSMTFGVFIVASLFDYIIPYTMLGFAGVFRAFGNFGRYFGMFIGVSLRLVCHYITGVTIWSQWTPDGWSSWIYSAAYNGGYLLPDFAICLVVAVLLLQSKQIRQLVGIKE